VSGKIDLYPEYTGTALAAILKYPPLKLMNPPIDDPTNARGYYTTIQEEYRTRFNVEVMPPLGFNNTFAMVVRGEDADKLRLRTISDVAPYAQKWRAGFGYEFMERPDGYRGLATTYGLHFAEQPRVMDLGLLARALKDHQIDLAAGNATDGLIPALDLFVLADDRHYFPPYEAVPVMREQTIQQHPEVGQVLAELAGKISDEEMQRLNYSVDGQHRDATEVVREFLRSKGLVQ
jgi:glycine betaine/choline ABC-type transport system substrate-binding protein